MSDRKYRQHGYQDSDRTRERSTPAPRKPIEPYDPRLPRDPRTPNMPGFRQVFRCNRCGSIENTQVAPESMCTKCGVPLHACIQCSSFDSGATFECTQAVPARVSPKDGANQCTLFTARMKVERETGSTPAPAAATSGARKAFDDLFKF